MPVSRNTWHYRTVNAVLGPVLKPLRRPTYWFLVGLSLAIITAYVVTIVGLSGVLLSAVYDLMGQVFGQTGRFYIVLGIGIVLLIILVSGVVYLTRETWGAWLDRYFPKENFKD